MQQQSRALAVFGGIGIVAVFAILVVIPRITRGEPGVAGLPTVPRELPRETGGPPRAVPYSFSFPSLSKTQIAFVFAGEIWTVPREGGTARRLVGGQLNNTRPLFSPDGSQIAYTGVLDNNADVYVVAATGGEPRRLTYHPGGDIALGWSPDGSKIIFTSTRATERDLGQLWTVPAAGGPAELVPPATPPRTRRMASASRTSRSFSGSRRGSTIAAARPRRSGSRISRRRTSRSCRARTRTSTSRCGATITRCTSRRIARARRRCTSPT